MNYFVIGFRLLHILPGAFWFGAILLYVFVVDPAVASMGDDGNRFLLRMMSRTPYISVFTIAALVNVLAGSTLYTYFAHQSDPWPDSLQGIVLAVGGVLAILAWLIGVVRMGRAARRLRMLGKQMDTAVLTAAQADEIQALRMVMRGSARTIALLLTVTLTCMVVARYLW